MYASTYQPRDAFSFQLLAEEGLFMVRLLDQQERYPESAASLILAAFPFLAVAEHDAIPFLNKRLGCKLAIEDSRITTIRHMTKSLDSKGFDFDEYSAHAEAVLRELDSRFYFVKGWRRLLNPLGTNVALAYYCGIPIYSTFSIVHLLAQDDPALLSDPGHTFEKEVGYKAGCSGSVFYSAALEIYPDPACHKVGEFKVQVSDWKYGDLAAPLKNRGVKNEAIYFFFSELLMLLTSVIALREAGFLEDAAWLKYSSLTLDHAVRAIDCFSAYIRGGKSGETLPAAFTDEVGGLLTRDEKKFVRRAHKLRNAMMHYDFTEKLVPAATAGAGPWQIMESAAQMVLGMSVVDYGNELFRIRDKLTLGIKGLLQFPSYNIA